MCVQRPGGVGGKALDMQQHGPGMSSAHPVAAPGVLNSFDSTSISACLAVVSASDGRAAYARHSAHACQAQASGHGLYATASASNGPQAARSRSSCSSMQSRPAASLQACVLQAMQRLL